MSAEMLVEQLGCGGRGHDGLVLPLRTSFFLLAPALATGACQTAKSAGLRLTIHSVVELTQVVTVHAWRRGPASWALVMALALVFMVLDFIADFIAGAMSSK